MSDVCKWFDAFLYRFVYVCMKGWLCACFMGGGGGGGWVCDNLYFVINRDH